MLTLMLAMALELAATPAPVAATPTSDGWQPMVTVTGAIDGVEASHGLLMYLPKGCAADPAKKRPLVLALHGWKHRADMFRTKGEGVIEGLADRYGYVIAIPEMGTTVYETALYPETKPNKAWSKVPGARWVGEVILPYVRTHYAVHGDRAHTGAIGYSTGGRGAFLLAELYPELAFAGSVSGTYDLMTLEPSEGEYRIHAVVYGPRAKFEERWQKDNVVSPALLPKLANVRMYAAHGEADDQVNPDQIESLTKAVRARLPGANAHIFDPQKAAGHDWWFWNEKWPEMFAAMAETFPKEGPD